MNSKQLKAANQIAIIAASSMIDQVVNSSRVTYRHTQMCKQLLKMAYDGTVYDYALIYYCTRLARAILDAEGRKTGMKLVYKELITAVNSDNVVCSPDDYYLIKGQIDFLEQDVRNQ